MHLGTLRALEFDRVREALTSLALTPLGSAHLATLEPFTDARRIEAALQATSEGVQLLGDQPAFPLRAPADFDTTVAALALADRPLEPLRLRGLSDALDSIAQVRALVRRQPRTSYPTLSALADAVATFEAEITAVRRSIDEAGDVVDGASPELRQIRERIRRQKARLRGTLESYVRGRDTSRYLQDLVVTDRNGRYVIVVKAEHRHSIPGIVHGTSASGASLYLEPLSTVELNNDVVALEEQEAAEVHRILLALTNAFRARALDVRRTLDAATELDAIQAKARFAAICRATVPALSTDGRLELRGARHPLLIPAVVARTNDAGGTRVTRTAEPTPVDVLIVPPTRVLVITGPNTGGKTVALKTTGLLALMAQAGLHIPADQGSALPVFQSVFADIGDEQSIEANLSTFSWHVTNIASMDRDLRVPALVLLDEVGAGTDPVEGGALGMAIIDHFRTRGAILVATTHYDALKSYASTAPNVTAAAFGFHPDTFVPTYRLMYGSPGSSLALEMAQRVGLPSSIVEAARGYRTDREAQLAEHLARIDRDLHALDHERRLVAHERARLTELDVQYKTREEALRDREAQFRRRLDDALQVRLREARRDIDAIVEEVRQKAAALAAEAASRGAQMPRLAGMPSTGETGGLKADARNALDVVANRLRRGSDEHVPRVAVAESEAAAAVQPIAVGVRVALPLGLEGIVQDLNGRHAEVSVNGKRMRAAVEDLRVIGGQAPSRHEERGTGRVTVHVNAHAPDGSSSELNVIGCSVAEALDRADKFLDQALMAEQHHVRVIHGHGTGQLRRALAEFLSGHPLVSRILPAPPNQGGGGATLVELKD